MDQRNSNGWGIGRGCGRGRGMDWNRLRGLEMNSESSPAKAINTPREPNPSSTDKRNQESSLLSKSFIPPETAKPQQKTIINDCDWSYPEERNWSASLSGWKTANPEATNNNERESPLKEHRRVIVKQEPAETQANVNWMSTSAYLQLDKDARSRSTFNEKQELRTSGACKLPSSYGQGVYEDMPSFVAKPDKNVEIDDYDWSDERTVNQPVNKQVVRKIPAGGGCNFFLAPGDKMIQCPYDKAHLILEPRFTRHLIKCRSNYVKQREREGKEIEFAVCTYNTAHHYHKTRSEEHFQTCETRLDVLRHDQMMDEMERENPEMFVQKPAFPPGAVEKAVAAASASTKASADPPIGKNDDKNIKVNEFWTSDQDQYDDNDWDDWGRGAFNQAYDPSIKIFDPTNVDPTFYIPQGLTKSENRLWRKAERLRVAEAERRKEEKDRVDKKRAEIGLPPLEEKERTLVEQMLDANETYHRLFSRSPYTEENARKGAIFKALKDLPREEWAKWHAKQSKDAWTSQPFGPSAESAQGVAGNAGVPGKSGD